MRRVTPLLTTDRNAPYILGVRAVAFPMAVGNTVVLKASELSPRVMWGIVSCFHEAGIPGGVLNMIAHAPRDASAVTTALIANPAIKKINFTGSTGVGRIIAKLAGEHLKPVLLELGGKAPAIVWEDADLSLAAVQCTLGAFLHGGQICMSTERIIVHKAVRGQFEKELAGAMGKIFPAEGDAPVLITEAAVGKTTTLVQDALDKGASLVAGAVPSNGGEGRARMRPIAIGGVTQQMDIFATESFGPSVAIYEVETEEEALKLANDTEYGLSSAVFTGDLSRGLRFAREIESGAVHINSMSVHDEPGLPHGGAKASGYGRFNATAGLEEWVRTKVVTFPI
jgi:acyl-CoA reductase-like NAD-dependent aldehyde dehydrogenase